MAGLGGLFYFMKLLTETGLTQLPLLIALTKAVVLRRLPRLIEVVLH
jgi:hypothetical protein